MAIPSQIVLRNISFYMQSLVVRAFGPGTGSLSARHKRGISKAREFSSFLEQSLYHWTELPSDTEYRAWKSICLPAFPPQPRNDSESCFLLWRKRLLSGWTALFALTESLATITETLHKLLERLYSAHNGPRSRERGNKVPRTELEDFWEGG